MTDRSVMIHEKVMRERCRRWRAASRRRALRDLAGIDPLRQVLRVSPSLVCSCEDEHDPGDCPELIAADTSDGGYMCEVREYHHDLATALAEVARINSEADTGWIAEESGWADYQVEAIDVTDLTLVGLSEAYRGTALGRRLSEIVDEA